MVIQQTFKQKIIRSGNSYVFTIPSFLIKQGLIDISKVYSVLVIEVDENPKHKFVVENLSQKHGVTLKKVGVKK